MAILNIYAVHDLYGLDAYILHTMYEQDLVVARHKRTSYTCALHAIRKYLMKFLKQLTCKCQI